MDARHTREAGFSLVEVLVALFMATIVFLMLAQMLGVGIEANRAASDMSRASALASSQLEDLTRSDYAAVATGGSINADINGFFETLDIDGDGVDDYRRRWEVADLGTSKRIRVRVQSLLDVIGPAKQVTYVALLADKGP